MNIYNPFTLSRRIDAPPCPPHVVYTAHRLDGGWFARCDGCGWDGELVALEETAWAAAIEHMPTNERKASV